MNHHPFPNRDDADRRNRENEAEQDRRAHVARCADSPAAGSATSDKRDASANAKEENQ